MSASIRLGTRGSALALWQAHWVADNLRALGAEVELVEISTAGDANATGPIAGIGVGVFTRQIQQALLDGTVDLAVHSLKDLPTEPVPGLHLAAVPPRGPVGDVLLSRNSEQLIDLPAGARIGTGSIRRKAQLLHQRRDLQVAAIRGNVDTRVRKLDEGQFDAIVLAQAGLHRLNLAAGKGQLLPVETMLPAVGQGALGLETRKDDVARQDWVSRLNDDAAFAAVSAERALLAALTAGCLAPVGALATADDKTLELRACVLSTDGELRLFHQRQGELSEPQKLGRQVADALITQGAGDLIAAAR